MSNIYIITQNAERIDIKFITFSDGTENCEFPQILSTPKGLAVTIVVGCFYDINRDLFRIGLVREALKQAGYNRVSLVLNYMPQARADRVFKPTNSLGVKVVADFINTLHFTTVYVLEAHSSKVIEYLDRVEVIDSILPFELKNKEYVYCAPDAGATERVKAKMPKGSVFLQAYKTRCPDTGHVLSFDFDATIDIQGKTIVMVDDICDGGGTFVGLAARLKALGCAKVILSVAHGIFPRGLKPFIGRIDEIHCTTIVCDYINHEHLMHFNNGDMS
ncbi:ribose-phosphate pyrophosphokinase [Pseudoalteromonas phage vB_PtuP_Slicky01]|nr:ribose-phosphate pyrophosphokinase [Pseudoalteromonas phage vB_PtuP_Slicky01]